MVTEKDLARLQGAIEFKCLFEAKIIEDMATLINKHLNVKLDIQDGIKDTLEAIGKHIECLYVLNDTMERF